MTPELCHRLQDYACAYFVLRNFVRDVYTVTSHVDNKDYIEYCANDVKIYKNK